MRRLLVLGTMFLAGCEPADTVRMNEAQSRSDPAPGREVAPSGSQRLPPAPAPVPALIGEAIARAEWAKSKDKAGCAPLALASDAAAKGKPRRADFSGGWGVAFDLPGLRSAYGFAGPGVLPLDRASVEAQRARLDKQWPYRMEIDTLPPPSFAGYGLSGAQPYPADNPEGKGMESVAYLRVGGQACTYNVWSRISRAHLEAVLSHLRLLR